MLTVLRISFESLFEKGNQVKKIIPNSKETQFVESLRKLQKQNLKHIKQIMEK